MPRFTKLMIAIGFALCMPFGCGSSSKPVPSKLDLQTSELSQGDYATVYDDTLDSLYLNLDGHDMGMIPVGTRVLVVADNFVPLVVAVPTGVDPREDQPLVGVEKPKPRMVLVNIQQGRYEGRACTLERDHLRRLPPK